jgi:hypothetical protein
MTSQERNRLDPTNRTLKLLNPTAKDEEDFKEGFAKQPRLKYAGMRAHMEMSAMALAAGSTQKMAARYAGVSPRQIKKYLTDPDFRARIQELRGLATSRLQGKIVRELNRRTDGLNIRQMELLDLLRIYDRMTTGGKGMAINVAGDMNVEANRYENILAALFSPDAPENEPDFPGYGPEDFSVPGGGPQLEG